MRLVELVILCVAGTLFFLGFYWFALYFHLIEVDLISLLQLKGEYRFLILTITTFLVSFLYALGFRAFFKNNGSMLIMISFGVLLFLGFPVYIKTPLEAEDFVYYGFSMNLHVVFLSYSIYYRTLVGKNELQER